MFWGRLRVHCLRTAPSDSEHDDQHSCDYASHPFPFSPIQRETWLFTGVNFSFAQMFESAPCRVPRGRGPHEQVFVRGVEFSILRPGFARMGNFMHRQCTVLLLFFAALGGFAQPAALSADTKRPMTFEDL